MRSALLARLLLIALAWCLPVTGCAAGGLGCCLILGPETPGERASRCAEHEQAGQRRPPAERCTVGECRQGCACVDDACLAVEDVDFARKMLAWPGFTIMSVAETGETRPIEDPAVRRRFRAALLGCEASVPSSFMPNRFLCRLTFDQRGMTIDGLNDSPHLRNCLEERVRFLGGFASDQGSIALSVNLDSKPRRTPSKQEGLGSMGSSGTTWDNCPRDPSR
jgi:hypothetical protein